jgi:hypothetical protein
MRASNFTQQPCPVIYYVEKLGVVRSTGSHFIIRTDCLVKAQIALVFTNNGSCVCCDVVCESVELIYCARQEFTNCQRGVGSDQNWYQDLC